jgi:hypothetical protein
MHGGLVVQVVFIKSRRRWAGRQRAHPFWYYFTAVAANFLRNQRHPSALAVTFSNPVTGTKTKRE